MNFLAKKLVLFFCTMILVTQAETPEMISMPSGTYSSQGCLQCTIDEELFCCKCPTIFYEKFTIAKDPTSIFQESPQTSLTEENLNRQFEFPHRFLDFQTLCLDSAKARECDGTIMLCGDFLICANELRTYQKKGWC